MRDLARQRLDLACNQLQQRRLAATVPSDEPGAPADVDREIQVFEYVVRRRRIAELELAQNDRGHNEPSTWNPKNRRPNGELVAQWTNSIGRAGGKPLHALDPLTYPRTAVIAYAMDPKELEKAMGEAPGAKLKAFYHSHPNHDAYFSDEDKAFACPFGEPNFPGAAQIVVSIYGGAVRRICAYAWSDGANDFVEVAVNKV